MRTAPAFGMMFFASHQDALAGEKYRVVIEAARFADQHEFSSVWVPERHFTRFGCLFPNPAVLQAALARETTRVRLHAGSVVLPLHDSIRVAEEWAMVDNLSGGRVGISFASGWNPDDFALRPQNYEFRHNLLFSELEKVRTLWQGGTIATLNGRGETVNVSVYPTPIQRELPVWITAAANPTTYERAGAAGANLLTHLLDHGVEKLAELIGTYRRARAAHHHDPHTGVVTVMLHTFVGENEDSVIAEVRAPFCAYLKSNMGLLEGLAASRGQRIDVRSLSPADLDAFVSFLFDRFRQSRALIGTPESCKGLVDELGRIGVDEIACLLDFGPPPDVILEHLPYLDRLRSQTADVAGHVTDEAGPTLAELRARCTEQIAGAEFYRRLEDRSVELTGMFSSVETAWRRDGEALALVRKPASLERDSFSMHPAFLDCMFQALVLAAPAADFDSGGLYLPAGLRSFEIRQEVGDEVWSHAVITRERGNSIEGTVTVRARSGEVLAVAEGLRLERSQLATTIGTGLMYDVEWRPLKASGVGSLPNGPWFIVSDEDELAAQLCALITAAGERCETGLAVEASGRISEAKNVVALGGWRRILPLANAIANDARLWIASTGAHALNGSMSDPDQAMLWGIGRTWSAEFSNQLAGTIDLDPDAPPETRARQLYATLTSNDNENQTAFRKGTRYVPRLMPRDGVPKRKLRLKEEASYLITGGRQGFGLEAARRLAERGARHLIIFGREAGPQSFPELEALGTAVTYAAVDVADHAAVREFIDNWSGPRIRGVIHAASIWRDSSGSPLVRMLKQLDSEAFEAVLRPKRDGALVLRECLKSEPLDFFVLFSSGASLIGSPGQANYAAASAWLDTLASVRHANDLPALSINWGPISEAGFGATPEGQRLHELWTNLGIERINPAEALDIMEALIRDGRHQSAVMRMNWERIAAGIPGITNTPYFEQLVRHTSPAAVPSAFIEQFNAVPEQDRWDLLLDHVRTLIAGVMELGPGEYPDHDRGLFESGMDSLMVLELKNRLQATLGRDIPATLAFEHPTVRAITTYLFERLVPETKPAAHTELSEVDSILERIQSMSDAQAQTALAVRTQPS